MKLVDKLRKFRQQCERQSGVPATDIEVPLSHVLDDMCQTLKLPAKQRRKVLGRRGWQRFEEIRDMPVRVVDRDA